MNNKSKMGAVLIASAMGLALATQSSAAVITGSDLHSASSSDTGIAALLAGNRGTNGGGDQSLQLGDVLRGGDDDDILIGGLGIDILTGGAGNDVLIGGTEDFNPFNRDRAWGGPGDDSFIWAPGDGNDFFDGGEGIDVVFFGVLGESTAPDGDTSAPPYFAVSPPNAQSTGNFDGIHINAGEPQLNISNGPGFCEIVERDSQNTAELEALDLDHIIRFVLRGPRAAFDSAIQADPSLDPDTLDTGLRVAVHLKNVEFLVCGGQTAGTVEIFDLTQVPAQVSNNNQLPLRATRIAASNP